MTLTIYRRTIKDKWTPAEQFDLTVAQVAERIKTWALWAAVQKVTIRIETVKTA